MQRIGLIGGMSWHSTAEYYRLINEEVNRRLGGQHSAEVIIASIDFQKLLEPWQRQDWNTACRFLIDEIKRLEDAGADFFLICSNAVHKVADILQDSTQLPLLHIADSVGTEIQKRGLKSVGLLGTKVTMEEDFYSKRLSNLKITTLIPSEPQRDQINTLIFSELVQGQFTQAALAKHKEIMCELKEAGAEGVILACTEIPILFSNEVFEIPLFDTVKLHSLAAVECALKS